MRAALEHKERVALSALIRHQDVELAHFLPEGEELLPALSAPLPTEPFSSLFGRIHHSWLADPLRQQSPELAQLYLAALPEESSETLASLLECERPSQRLSPPLQAFFLDALSRQMGLSPVIPEQLLPESPCRPLLDLPKRELVRLVTILGLHDLAATFRRYIDSGPQRQILGLLTPNQESYLKWAMRQPAGLNLKPLALESWGRDREALLQQCQAQGLRRLAGALALEERSLLWHISHRLDKGRGQLLLQRARDKIDPHQSHRLLGQVIHVVQGMQGGTP